MPEAKEPATSSGDKLQFCADQFRVELNDFCTGMRLIVAGANLNPTGKEFNSIFFYSLHMYTGMYLSSKYIV